MNMPLSTIRAITTGFALIATVACSGGDSVGPAENADVPVVSIRLTDGPFVDSGWEYDLPIDEVPLKADVLDKRGQQIGDKRVAWQLKSSTGAAISDTVATIKSTGLQTATLAFHPGVQVTVEVVALVDAANGTPAKGTLYLNHTP